MWSGFVVVIIQAILHWPSFREHQLHQNGVLCFLHIGGVEPPVSWNVYFSTKLLHAFWQGMVEFMQCGRVIRSGLNGW
jgi:hypothetical protein